MNSVIKAKKFHSQKSYFTNFRLRKSSVSLKY